MRTQRIWLVGLGLLILLSGFAGFAAAKGTPVAPNPDLQPIVSDASGLQTYVVPDAQVQGAQEVWTAAAMESAQPAELVALDPGERLAAAEPIAEPLSEGLLFAGKLPDANADAWARAEFPEAWAEQGVEGSDLIETDRAGLALPQPDAVSGAYPPPFNRTPINKTWRSQTYMAKEYPWRTVGRLFYTVPGYGRYSCTAAVAANRALWTAGHCVYTPGVGWHQDMMFVPAYRWGLGPFGWWTITRMSTLNGWIYKGNVAYDIAMVVVSDRNGRSVSSYTGYLGTSLWGNTQRHWNSFGYPGRFDNGRFMYTCQGAYSRRDALPGPNPVSMGCDLLHGSSGGPWIYKFTPFASGAKNYVNGVFSYYYENNPAESYSPYFAEGAKNLFNWGRTK